MIMRGDLETTLERELKSIPEAALKKIDNWARENNQKRDIKIQAVYFHPDPESGKGAIYLITDSKHQYSDELDNEITDLEMEILKKDNVDITLMEWPVGYDGIEDYGFFKELCIFNYVKGKAA